MFDKPTCVAEFFFRYDNYKLNGVCVKKGAEKYTIEEDELIIKLQEWEDMVR